MDLRGLLHQTTLCLKKMKCSIQANTFESGFYEIVLFEYGTNKKAAYIHLGLSQTDLYLAKTRLRSTEPIAVDTINVVSLVVKEAYRGRGLAGLLLIYGLCYLKNLYPSVEYSVLEDVSDGAHLMTRNIYARLGYEHRDHVNLSNTHRNSVDTSSPTKVLDMKKTFFHKANIFLENI
jgi:hypothetical protein